MKHFDFFAIGFFNTCTDLQYATGIRRDDGVSVCAGDVPDFTLLKAFGHFRFGKVVAAGAAAADVRFGEFDVIRSRHGFDQVAWLFGDALRMREMTGIVIGDSIGPGAKFLVQKAVGNEEFG